MPPSTKTPVALEVRDVTFPDFLLWLFPRWKQGQHAMCLGHTGCGKTTLVQYLLRRFGHVISFNTKDEDSSARRFITKEGFVRQGGVFDGSHADKILLWPTMDKGMDADDLIGKQRYVFLDAMNKSYRQKGWAWYYDEVSYLSDFLGMSRRLRWALQQTRSNHITVIGATQRPAFIPLAFYDQPDHLFFWVENDEANLKRIRGIGGVNGKLIQEAVKQLEQYQVLYVHTRAPFECIRFTVNL